MSAETPRHITREKTVVPTETEAQLRSCNVFSSHTISLEVSHLNDLQIVASMPKALQDRAMAMAEKEQIKRHEITDREHERAHERYLDSNQKNYNLGLRRIAAISHIDIAAKIATCLVVLSYLAILAGSIILNRMAAFYTLSVVGGAIAAVIGYLTNNKKN